jgi:endogenous inhibitor of DNA gyrase (YacG/DUF329 family)
MPADPPKGTDEPGSGKRCPECGKPAENPKTLPFCSPRCRDVDLNRWLSGRYVIPGRENAGEDEE